MAEHILKTWPVYFDAVKSGDKPFEIRRNADRAFQKGDTLVLQRTNSNEAGSHVVRAVHPTHRYPLDEAKDEIRKLVTYVLPGGVFGIDPGYVVMGLADITPTEKAAPHAP